VRRRTLLPSARDIIGDLLSSADIRIDGRRAWDIRVHDERFFRRVLFDGSLGVGESYMDGWWDCEALDEMCFRASRAQLEKSISLNWRNILGVTASFLINRQTRRRATAVVKRHYDLGNDFFEAMLDPAMQYTCAYFEGTSDLAEAQRRKMDLICRKLGLRPDMRLLDIGCGWGGFAKYAAENYGCRVVGITISKEQQKYAERICHGLPVEIRLQDYRDLSDKFDRVIAVGVVEHVGFKNYRRFMKTVCQSLEEDGLFLCQAIAASTSNRQPDPWIARYIFPNSLLPSAAYLTKAAEGLFVLEDIQNFGAYYDATLMAWDQRFRDSWERFREEYGERFYRMWRFYLLSCAGAFRARSLQLYQFVFSSGGVIEGYRSPEKVGRTGFEPVKA
jgi:cyclopropane-fatty-acyl-phospholipid synthase